jgi:chromosome segregation ATPase
MLIVDWVLNVDSCL